jgi:DNA-binding CsgD family transcriptional regulator/PAS domain-containing protein
MLPDNEVLSQVLEALYEVPLDPSRWEEFLKLTAKAAGEGAAALLLRDLRDTQANPGIYRGRKAGRVEEHDPELVRFLRPHIKRAYRFHSYLAAFRKQRASLQSALDSLVMGVILLARNGRVVTMNRAAERLLADNDGLQASREGLRANRADESARLQQFVAEATATTAGAELRPIGALTVSCRGRPPLQLLVSPVHGFDVNDAHPVRAIVFVSDPAQKVRPTYDTVRALFGLTPAEYRVAVLLVDGYVPTEIAKMVGVSRNTVKSQLASIYRKTGTSRQVQFVRLLLQLPATQLPATSPRVSRVEMGRSSR